MTAKDDKKRFIEALRENHIALAVCRKTGIGKSTYYRWRESDPKFAASADAAIREGVALVNDAVESNIVSGVKNRDRGYTLYWADRRHPDFAPHLVKAADAFTRGNDAEAILSLFAVLKPKTREALKARYPKREGGRHG